MINLNTLILIVGTIFLLAPKRIFELNGIGYVKTMHYFLKIIGSGFILFAVISIYLHR
jgi:hypothetical protein